MDVPGDFYQNHVMRRFSGRSSPSAYTRAAILIATAMLAYWGAHSLMMAGSQTDPNRTEFIALPDFAVWVAILSGEVAAWVVIAAVFLSQMRGVRREFGLDYKTAALPTVLTFIAVVLIIFIPLEVAGPGTPPELFFRSTDKIAVLYWLGLGVSSLGILTFNLIYQAAQETGLHSQVTTDVLRKLGLLQTSLRRTISMLGIIVSLLVIGTGAYMNTVRAFRATSAEAAQQVLAPSQSVLIAYGSVFVLALLAMYVPASRSVRSLGLRVVLLVEDESSRSSAVVPASPSPRIEQMNESGQPRVNNTRDQPVPPTLQATLQQRAELRSLLGVDTTIEQNLRGAVVVLSPLITSAIAVFLGG